MRERDRCDEKIVTLSADAGGIEGDVEGNIKEATIVHHHSSVLLLANDTPMVVREVHTILE